MTYDFDRIIDRRSTNSVKWKKYGEGILPLWVADMDFAAPEPIQAALRGAVEHGIYGYEFPSKELTGTVAARMEKLYNWKIPPEAVIATPGVISGFVTAANAVCTAGEGILVQPPVYPPFLSVHEKTGLIRQEALLKYEAHNHVIHYEMDWDGFEKGLNANGVRTGMFLLCNPHNPTGRVFSRSDLARMADLCIKNGTVICSDEIHAELTLGNVQHLPIASLDSEVAAHTITLIAPSKTFNVAGLFCAFAIVPDPEIREQYKKTVERMTLHVGSPGLIAAQTAFSGACDDWLDALRIYLRGNLDFLVEFIKSELPGIKTTIPEATYLAWLDCRELPLEPSPHQFFLEKAKVALNDGSEFGAGGEGFVRLNFGCPRKVLEEALVRMKSACSPFL
jgi:cystathionine beta-lyase